ncbi:SDR family oxidoreductase [Pararhizobium mangrovi]|uniref:SDR family oxidoreductase n=1 Tax=Pararhizobium mangrovi TaxID=2590452 RepID=A0A506TYK0_9HYPH|nr:SDR family oxidoreductase [Pararhizobium mangrovi]TPW26061.1 SDR family oxidoreductase [Pararhizobium mangrovi]
MAAIADQRVLVTAAAQGIGRASALAFARAGARVVATDVNAGLLDELSGTPGIETRVLDVLDATMVDTVVAECGPLDVLFNCAGFVHSGTILDMREEELAFGFDLNVAAMIRTIRAALPSMIERRSGCIINMSSVAGSVKGVPGRFVYATTKAAVVGLTKAVAADYVSQGIRCNCICPGTVESPSLEERMRATGDAEAAKKAFVARQAMGRLGRPEEIADLAVYLAGATYTTGQAHVIDGGWVM